MAGKQPPDLKDITSELVELSWEDAKQLALQLGVKKASFDKIEEERHKTEARKLEAMDLWLKKDVDASWEKIVDALKELELNPLAETIRRKYCSRSAAGGAGNTAPSAGTPSRLSDRPSLAQLQKIRGADGKDLNIIGHVAADWANIAVNMDFDPTGATQRRIGRTYRGDAIECCTATFTTWLEGEGNKQPPTWSMLIQILEDCSFRVLASDVKQALKPS